MAKVPEYALKQCASSSNQTTPLQTIISIHLMQRKTSVLCQHLIPMSQPQIMTQNVQRDTVEHTQELVLMAVGTFQYLTVKSELTQLLYLPGNGYR